MKFKRVFLIVMDSVGIGTCPDSYKFGDDGAATIQHIAESKKEGIHLPNMEALGYGKIAPIRGLRSDIQVKGIYGKMQELSSGKDTMTGHWEMMGIETTKPFVTFTETGFPKELIDLLEERTGRKVIGNKAASGTEILEELGEEQRKTGALIVYTSADPVLQIAADENLIPLEELYRDCKIAREITLKEEWKVGRIIARPYLYLGDGKYQRTTNRHDYSVTPPEKTTLNFVQDKGLKTISVGKISDIFNAYGVDDGNHITSNHNGMEITTDIVKNKDFTGFCFVNLVDFDALYGHRRNVEGYYNAMVEFDADLGNLMKELKEGDLLLVTADHGNDPTWTGTDHTREFVPVLGYYKGLDKEVNLGTRTSFADLGATVSDNFETEMPRIGVSFLKEI